MKEVPAISIVIPAYNQAQYLPTAIESVLAQTYRDFEIIVVDDGSTDATPEIAQSYPEVRYIRQANQGLAGARNTGIESARTELVALLDSDDAWRPTFLEKMMTLVVSHPQATVYYCGVCYIDPQGKSMPQPSGGKVVPPDEMYWHMLRANSLVPSTIVMRREPLLATGLFDVKFRRLQDWELWVRLLRQGHLFAGLAEGLIDYRLHDSSLSTDPSGGQEAAMAMVVKHFGIDDGRPEGWSTEKRRAYGGVYRYHGVTASLLRAGDWQACGRYLRQAFQADPSLAEDLDLFYELALGVQPLGQRGLSGKLRLADNAAKIKALLEAIYQPPLNAEMAGHRARAFNMAYHALGLVAYNTGCDQLTARFLLIALRFRPSLPQLKRSGSLLLKTFLLRPAIRMVRSVKSAPQFGSQKPETQER